MERRPGARPAASTRPRGTMAGWLKRHALGIDPEEARFARRGFARPGSDAARRLETCGLTFIHGYTTALEATSLDALAATLSEVIAAQRGFAFEGAGMALALLDQLTPWQRGRLARFLAGPASAHVYMVHVGAGWAMARLGRGLGPYFRRMHPLLRWLAVDGHGFHAGYFQPARFLEAGAAPPLFGGFGDRVFDQGLGRSLWFACCAHGARIGQAIDRFAPARHEDLWSGVGLAAAYAGGASSAELTALCARAGAHKPALAQGAAFAAQARERAGNPADHTERACQALCGMSARDAAEITTRALHKLDRGADSAAYEQWRQRVQEHFRR